MVETLQGGQGVVGQVDDTLSAPSDLTHDAVGADALVDTVRWRQGRRAFVAAFYLAVTLDASVLLGDELLIPGEQRLVVRAADRGLYHAREV